ncbi:hypothetical protein BJ508DRAFT_380197 [Ascobolus immersus RN42]|uniref:Uncharacterized protein n=1 Tax=Ascobolus immersus RN42 TaxID=1160509 RepID=A0A3N4HPH8_ASCIM|nr:hypothetical protein BJ508DRAFT_380197 [Ascobolus immersus RN42]
MDKLPTDVLREIVDYLDASPENFQMNYTKWPPKRYYPARQGQGNDGDSDTILSLRLVNRRFGEICASYIFRCVVHRNFNRRGFEQLQMLAEKSHLAAHVKKFVYLVPYRFVEGSRNLSELINKEPIRKRMARRPFTRRLVDNPDEYRTVLHEQNEIIRTNLDLVTLRKAMEAFTSLQHIHILPLVGTLNTAHRKLEEFALDHRFASPDSWPYPYSTWEPACKRALETVFDAIDSAGSATSIRTVALPALHPSSFSRLNPRIKEISVKAVWNHLTYLEIQFDSQSFLVSDSVHDLVTPPTSPVTSNAELREFFGLIFRAAQNLEVVYLGFHPSNPVNIPLEDIFHEQKWSKLRAFGIDSWLLSARELVGIVERHKHTLRGLRLGNIRLRKPDLWVRDVVVPLRTCLESMGLRWISLDGCQYLEQMWGLGQWGMDGGDEDGIDGGGFQVGVEVMDTSSEGSMSGSDGEGSLGHHSQHDEGITFENDFPETPPYSSDQEVMILPQNGNGMLGSDDEDDDFTPYFSNSVNNSSGSFHSGSGSNGGKEPSENGGLQQMQEMQLQRLLAEDETNRLPTPEQIRRWEMYILGLTRSRIRCGRSIS